MDPGASSQLLAESATFPQPTNCTLYLGALLQNENKTAYHTSCVYNARLELRNGDLVIHFCGHLANYRLQVCQPVDNQDRSRSMPDPYCQSLYVKPVIVIQCDDMIRTKLTADCHK